MWRKLIGFAAPICVVAPLLIFACSSAKDSQKFAANAAQGGIAEVEFGRLATQRARDSSVREFGARMVADHPGRFGLFADEPATRVWRRAS